MSERESRKGFVVDNGVVKETIGYSCANPGTPFGNPDYWWCPSVGFSTSSFYSEKSEAVKEAEESCQRSIKLWQDRLNNLSKIQNAVKHLDTEIAEP